MTLPPYGPAGGTPSENALPPTAPTAVLPTRAAGSTLVTAALAVGIAAFALGLVPLIGALLGAAGIVLAAIVMRRGLASRRTYLGAAAAAIGALTSIAASVALVGFLASGTDPAPEQPTVAAGSTDEDEPGSGDSSLPADPAAEAEGESDPPVDEPSEEAPTSEEPTTVEPVEETTPAVVPEDVDRDDFDEIDERELAQIVKAPDDHLARQVVVYGTITQLDAATGKCVVRVSLSHADQDEWYDYEHNSIGFAGDGESDCPILDPFVTDDEVKLWITVGGSFSYDTQIGGSTTVPAYLINDIELV